MTTVGTARSYTQAARLEPFDFPGPASPAGLTQNTFTLSLKYGKLRRMKTRYTMLVACLLLGEVIASGQSTPAPGDYTVALQVTQGAGSSTWIYTVTRAPSTAKEIPHFTIDFGNCGDDSPTLANVVSATVNGVNWMNNLSSTETSPGCGVTSSKVVVFNNLPNLQQWTIAFTLNDNY